MEKELVLDIIGFDPFNLPNNDCNISHRKYFKMRALFKLMLFVHRTINFPRHFDPDLGQYRKNDEGIEKIPLTYDPIEIVSYRTGNCATYSTLFEVLAKSIGFEVRHIGLISPNKSHGHWCSEIWIEDKWCFFDSMYLICPVNMNKDKEGYSAYEIMKDPYLYINNILDIFKGISEQTWLDLWKGLEINKIKSYDMDKKEFFNKFYGKDNE